jgi:hypothetical protein
VALAAVLAAAGRATEAAVLTTRAHDLYERKGNLVAAGRLQADLARPGTTA